MLTLYSARGHISIQQWPEPVCWWRLLSRMSGAVVSFVTVSVLSFVLSPAPPRRGRSSLQHESRSLLRASVWFIALTLPVAGVSLPHVVSRSGQLAAPDVPSLDYGGHCRCPVTRHHLAVARNRKGTAVRRTGPHCGPAVRRHKDDVTNTSHTDTLQRYLFNPYCLLSCLARSTTSLDNALVLAAITGACIGTWR